MAGRGCRRCSPATRRSVPRRRPGKQDWLVDGSGTLFVAHSVQANQQWETPAEVAVEVRRRWSVDYDAMATPMSALAPDYATKEDGVLRVPLHDRVIFCNPAYAEQGEGCGVSPPRRRRSSAPLPPQSGLHTGEGAAPVAREAVRAARNAARRRSGAVRGRVQLRMVGGARTDARQPVHEHVSHWSSRRRLCTANGRLFFVYVALRTFWQYYQGRSYEHYVRAEKSVVQPSPAVKRSDGAGTVPAAKT